MRTLGWLGLAVLALPAMAQTPPGMMGTPISGRVLSVHGSALRVVSAEGPVYDITLAKNARLMAVKAMTAADIHVGDFVGSGATKNADGSFTAREVHIIAQRGMGGGQRQMGNDPNHVMTNADVTSIAAAPPGEIITLTLGSHKQPIYVPPDVPVTSMGPAKASDLAPGAKLRLFATTGKAGDLEAGMVMVTSGGAQLP